MCSLNFYVSDVIIVCTLVYQIDVQDKNKRVGGKILKKTLKVQDRINVQGKFSGKSINMQGKICSFPTTFALKKCTNP